MGRSEAPCVPAGCLSLPSLLAAWSGDERPDRPGSPPVRGRTRSPQPVREEGPGGADGAPVERARAVARPHRPAAIEPTLARKVTAERPGSCEPWQPGAMGAFLLKGPRVPVCGRADAPAFARRGAAALSRPPRRVLPASSLVAATPVRRLAAPRRALIFSRLGCATTSSSASRHWSLR